MDLIDTYLRNLNKFSRWLHYDTDKEGTLSTGLSPQVVKDIGDTVLSISRTTLPVYHRMLQLSEHYPAMFGEFLRYLGNHFSHIRRLGKTLKFPHNGDTAEVSLDRLEKVVTRLEKRNGHKYDETDLMLDKCKMYFLEEVVPDFYRDHARDFLNSLPKPIQFRIVDFGMDLRTEDPSRRVVTTYIDLLEMYADDLMRPEVAEDVVEEVTGKFKIFNRNHSPSNESKW
ncbi:hypothetical protein KY328_03135 [Candidatus Woesearchaeota archaeon]|nr:hypothetical protein [Candidatus Woesearchaeota archaeon]MBW3021887.1 hypothetical protein [Candidatus Woesearchaeota archaeon]